MVKKTAEELNNTPAVCREYYIHPDIIKAWEDGYLSKAMKSRSSANNKKELDKTEAAVLKILKRYSAESKAKSRSTHKPDWFQVLNNHANRFRNKFGMTNNPDRLN